MRMRRKSNLNERAEAAYPYLYECGSDDPDSRIIDVNKPQLDLNFDTYELELGCGKGKFALEYAAKHPDVGFIAVDQITNVVIVGAEKAKAESRANLRFIRTGAEYLNRYFDPKTFKRIYLNFPCPYHKETYRNRRLTSPALLKLYEYLLVDDGAIILKTDNKRMFEYSLETLSSQGFLIKNVSLDLYNSKYIEDNIATEYETNFVTQGLPIMRLEAYKQTRH